MLSVLEMLLPLIAVILVVGPLWFFIKKGANQNNAKQRLIAQISIFCGVFVLAVLFQINGIAALAEGSATASGIAGTTAQGLGFIAAALATGCSAIGAGWAVASAAPAAIGAISENSENFGKAIIFVALGEGVAIYGLLISILIINKL
ncbi:MAG: ATP synthase subunit C [Erysipelotrichaceae bacterium]|nr:ATP synthase subunit C [Erysipelotrichaceae bacterium]MDY5251806.1 ATP synthase subunit C [Erysipelotrichaceae bacterium]